MGRLTENDRCLIWNLSMTSLKKLIPKVQQLGSRGALQQMVYHRRSFTTVEQLKETIVTEWTKLSQRFIDRAIDQWRRRLQCVSQQQGGHIEHFM